MTMVKFWPKPTSIPLEICNHRFGAEMTFSVSSDTRILTSVYAAQLYGFRHNVRMGAFVSSLISNSNVGVSEEAKTGIIRHDMYFATDMWKNPTTGICEIFPDYYSTVWTSAGVAAYPETAVLGAAKANQFPNHGLQLYSATNGRLGYNVSTSTMGSSNLSELYGLVEYEQQFYSPLINRTLSISSFRNGQSGCSIPNISKYLAQRNSIPSPAGVSGATDSFYGFSHLGTRLGLPISAVMVRQTWASFPNTYRWWDSWNNGGNTKTDATNYMIAQLNVALANEGWYRDFMHWHNAKANSTITSIEELFEIFRTTLSGHFVWSCSYGEAIEYMFLRTITDRVSAYEKDNNVIIVADIEDSFKGSSTNGISNNLVLSELNIPLSVKVDLTGTYLAGKNVKSSFGKIRSLGSNVYIVEIPFKGLENIYGIVLSEGENGIYNETIPTATVNTVDTTMTVTCNIPCKVNLFSVTSGGNDYDSTIIDYSNDYNTVHTFTVTSGKDYRVGIISEFLQANLIE